MKGHGITSGNHLFMIEAASAACQSRGAQDIAIRKTLWVGQLYDRSRLDEHRRQDDSHLARPAVRFLEHPAVALLRLSGPRHPRRTSEYPTYAQNEAKSCARTSLLRPRTILSHLRLNGSCAPELRLEGSDDI